MRSITPQELRSLALKCGAAVMLLFAAIFISGGGIERSLGSVAAVQGTTQAAGTALGNAQGVPYAGTATGYPANYQGCYINWSYWQYGAESGPLCDSPNGSSSWGQPGDSDTFGAGVFSIDAPAVGQGRTLYQTRTHTIPYSVVDGAPSCGSGTMVQSCNGTDAYGACTSYAWGCSDGSVPSCSQYGGSSTFDASNQCSHDAGGLSGPSGNNAAGAGSLSVPVGTPYTLQWSCLPQRSVYYEYKTGQGTFSTGYWVYGTIYSYYLAQSLAGSWTNDPLFPSSTFAAQGLTGSYTITPTTAGTFTYNLNCYGASNGMPISVTVTPPACSDNGTRSCSGNTVVNNCGSAVTSCGGGTPVCSNGSCVAAACVDNGIRSCSGNTVVNNCGSAVTSCSGGTPVCSNGSCIAGTPTNTAPRGNLDSASCTFDGWAQDEDAPSQAIDVHFYIDGVFGGATNASTYRADLCSAIGSCNHGFSFPAPAQYKDGLTHSVNAYAIDTAGGSNPSLGTKAFSCAPSCVPSGALSCSGTNVVDSCGTTQQACTNGCSGGACLPDVCSDTNALNYGATATCTYVGCSLSASPSRITLGGTGSQSSTLSWNSSSATSCTLSAGQGYSGGSGLSGSGTTATYTVPARYPYTLNCTGPSNSVGPTTCSATANVRVTCPSGTAWDGSACVVPVIPAVSINASPTSVTENGSNTSTYTITNSGTSAISNVRYTIANANGATCGFSGDYRLSGLISSCSSGTISSLPVGNSTVTLTAGSRSFSGTRSATITIAPPSSGNAYAPAASPNNAATVVLNPISITITATPAEIFEGGKVATFTINNPGPAASNVAYTITNGSGATCGFGRDYSLSGKIASCSTSGTISSVPSGNSTVTLTSGNTTFAGSRPVTITITSSGSAATVSLKTDPGTMNSFTASPTRVMKNGVTTLKWDTSGFTSCALTSSQGGGTLSSALTSAGFQQTITARTTFTLTCRKGLAAPVAQSVTVNLIPTYQEI